MKIKNYLSLITILFTLLFISCASLSNESASKNTDKTGKNELYKEIEEANALKGFVPFLGNYTSRSMIPASMEFFYIPLNKIMTAENTYDFSLLESNLEKIKEHGNQTIFRVYLDYPDEPNGTPDFFWDLGIEKIYYKSDNGICYFPDYTNQKCMDLICDCIRELGKKYDGDPRIAYIFAGFVGHWGEWHNYMYTQTPGHQGEKMPNDTQKAQFVKTFGESFRKTSVLVRTAFTSALNDYPNIGFHDDSFTQDTIGSDAWNFMPGLRQTGMTSRWKSAAIGGEFRPEHQAPFVYGINMPSGYQNYEKCLKETHCSWLLFDRAFGQGSTTAKERLRKASNQSGYDLYCKEMNMEVAENELLVDISIANVGIAPVYYNWNPVLALEKDGKLIFIWKTPFEDWDLPSILPDSYKDYSCKLKLPENLSSDKLAGYKLVLGIPNPMENGVPLKLSNTSLNQDYPGFITIGEF